MPRLSTWVLLGVTVAAMAVAGAACSGESKSNAHPTPSPTPFNPTNCQIAWFTAEAAPGKYDVYVVDMPTADWTTGSKNFGGTHNGIFYKGFDLSAQVHTASALATAGTFMITVSSGTAVGESIAFNDPDAQGYVTGVPGSVIGSGGIGTFHGVWSDPSPSGNPSFGAGTVSLVYQTTSFTLGADATMAMCYSGTPFQSYDEAPLPVPLPGLERADEILAAHRGR